MDRPSYLSDLNPIEHAWAKLKEMIDSWRLYPDLEYFLGAGEELTKHLVV